MATSSNQAQVNGRGNIVLQDIHGSSITINPRDPEFEAILTQNGIQTEEIERLKREAGLQQKKYQQRLLLLTMVLAAVVAIATWLLVERLQQPFDYALTVVDGTGQPSLALTGELDKLVLPPGENLLTDTLELSYFYLTQSNPPIQGRIEGAHIYFDDLPPSFRSQPLPFRLDSRFYQVKGQPQTLLLEGKNGQLVIERNEALCCLRGFVGARDRGNAALAGAKVFLADQEASSDQNGNFEIQVPQDQQQRQLKIRISHPGYRDLRRTVYLELQQPGDGAVPFLLTPSSE